MVIIASVLGLNFWEATAVYIGLMLFGFEVTSKGD
jgi:hypothetical protein